MLISLFTMIENSTSVHETILCNNFTADYVLVELITILLKFVTISKLTN